MNTTIFKVNQRKKSVLEVSSILNNCELLLRLEIEDLGSKVVLHIITDCAAVQYTEVNKTSMLSFLSKLKEYVISKDDIDELLEEVQGEE
ncbi:hypothetical protein [Paenibacillus larvae]|uniref:hypothetical protein n=1 Tax=Paenibacillus larvae TaxID=1464 RepID=UPI000169465B|nr:hypothetical protein [Paenibacillus larvae]